MTASDKIRAKFRESGADLGELAALSGCDRSNLKKFMEGTIGIKLDKGVELAAILGVDIRQEHPGMVGKAVGSPKIRTIKSVAPAEEPSILIEKRFGGGTLKASGEIKPSSPLAVPVPVKPPMTQAMIAKRKKMGMPTD